MSKNFLDEARDYEEKGDLFNAILTLKKALQLEPKNLIIQINLGNLCVSNKQFEEAAGYFRRCYRYFRSNPEIKDALCFSLTAFGNENYLRLKFELSEACFEEVLEYEKNNWVYYYNLANTQDKLNESLKAYKNYQKAIELNPDDADLWNNKGNIERKLGYLDKAVSSYKRALTISPDLSHTQVHLAHQKQHMCDWENIEPIFKNISSTIRADSKALIPPFAYLSNIFTSPSNQLQCASQWAQNNLHIKRVTKQKKQKKNPIHIGYLSSDFKLHPLYFLMRDVIRYHDRKNFTIFAYDSSPKEKSIERKTFLSFFDHVKDISFLDDEKAANLIDQDDIDILVDLTGYTNNSRAFIAPQLKSAITINWLGFPGTMGFFQERSLYDYILADEFIIPREDEKYYAESIIRFPFPYQPNNADRSQINKKTRQDYNLPDDAIVYCAFNQSFKISEIIFNTWLGFLKQYPKSILWLTHSNNWATDNLKKYAEKSGVLPERIIFASRVTNTEHIARHALADIYLDTLPYNAHTSASDALSMDLPIVTIIGNTFSSRVAGSLLHSLDLDELITKNLEEYIKCVAKLTEDLNYRKNIIERLKKAKINSAIFKPQLFVKNLEEIYQKLI